MIVKVSKGDGKWLLLNDVRSVDYSSVSHTAQSGVDLQKKLDGIQQKANGCVIRNALLNIDWANPPRSVSPSTPYKFSSMLIEHDDQAKSLVLFDHPVYLCNDAGTTVEKISVK